MNTALLRARAVALSDQSWEALKELLPEIMRVADCGPGPNDRDLVCGVFHAVAGDLLIRLGDARSDTPDPTPQEPRP